MSEMLENLLKELEGGFEDPDVKINILEMQVFLAMEKYLRQRTVIKSVNLADTILEGDDLNKELTIMHENSFKDMDKVFEILGKKGPPNSVKMKKITENVDETLSIIKEYRAKKRDRDE